MKPLSLLATLTLGLSMAATTAYADNRDEFSKANQLLFLTPHMDALDESGIDVRYRYERSGTHQEPDDVFSDHITLTITDVLDDSFRAGEVEFLTGERQRPFPGFRQARGNPVLAGFLQHDVHRMGLASSAPVRYFQDRIKIKLEEEPVMEEVSFEFDGEEFDGHRITVTPYADDSDRSRYDREFWEKYYVFTVSEELPGFIYQLEAVAPNSNGEEPYYKDVLTLESIERP
ncbi:hypothetical protein M0534_03575 [Methylonatrum kenyense]|uniref:hypothetical protein n=1 Tax=Methylonatrum kenyense TaxID=455253 RepID=UPI0020BF8DF9|nr:hypothetical protein [Methylonatrum kenyense]MCK8515416.1 hypothetical protein [Methylonatrum kenyense]